MPTSACIQALWAETIGNNLPAADARRIQRALRNYAGVSGERSRMADDAAVRKVLRIFERHAEALVNLIITSQKRKYDRKKDTAEDAVVAAIARLERRPRLRGLVQFLIELKDAAEKEIARPKRRGRGPDKDFGFDVLIHRLDRIAQSAGAKTAMSYKSEDDLDGEDGRAGYYSTYLDFLIALLEPPKSRGAFAKSVQRARNADVGETE